LKLASSSIAIGKARLIKNAGRWAISLKRKKAHRNLGA
jgi:hypothetical protein